MQKRNRIADMPLEERPYEKCLKYGAKYLTDAELLAIVIRTGTKGERSLDIAARVLEFPSGKKGLLGIHHCTTEQLMQIRGVGKVKAIQLKCIAELARRLCRLQAEEGLCFREPETIAKYYMEDYRHEEKENCVVLMLDTKCKLLKEIPISVGSVNASIVSPREIFREAFLCNAVQFILMHNHPSGDPQPSQADINLTMRVRECGELMDIPLTDHIIIGDNCYTSLREIGIIR